ncbi:MAG: hypothetical protein EA370_04120 [Wenzhouxiangella sp.]|nr:MAG: hypothetical protein EA370_04120 [Wenzhouxiangella sp.]
MMIKHSLAIHLLIIASCLLVAGSSLANQSFSSLEERMTGREFRETGLYKLSDEELAALNRWIRQRSLAEGETGATVIDPDTASTTPQDARGLRESSSAREPIRSRIVGTFDGWRGDTEFELENGMVWRQAEVGTFAIRAVENPEVQIRPGMFGAWRLRVEGYNSQVRVERIR